MGNAFLAVLAGKGFGSPVYLSVVAQNPGHPINNPFGGVMMYPGHSFDWQMAFESKLFLLAAPCSQCRAAHFLRLFLWVWRLSVYEIPFGEVVAPPYDYTPTSGDKIIGGLMRNEWFDLIENGHIRRSSGFKAVNDCDGFPANWNTGGSFLLRFAVLCLCSASVCLSSFNLRYDVIFIVFCLRSDSQQPAHHGAEFRPLAVHWPRRARHRQPVLDRQLNRHPMSMFCTPSIAAAPRFQPLRLCRAGGSFVYIQQKPTFKKTAFGLPSEFLIYTVQYRC